MKILLKIIFLLIVISGCNHEKELRIGVYRNIRPNKLQQACYALRGVHSFTLGDFLKLKSDSTFELTTCGNIMTGKWKATNDSVFLYVFSNKFRKDSLNKLEPEILPAIILAKPFGYKRNKKGLELIEITKKNKKSIDKLNYISP